MRLVLNILLIIVLLCIVLINGKFYQPKRQCNSNYDPEVDETDDGCRKACNAACEENCQPTEYCKEFGADYTRTKSQCISCICPEGI